MESSWIPSRCRPPTIQTGNPTSGRRNCACRCSPSATIWSRKKIEIAVQLSKLAIAKRISVEQGIEVDPDSLEVELIFILSRDDTRDQQLKQGYPIDPNHPSVLRRLEKGSFFRFKLVEGAAPAP